MNEDLLPLRFTTERLRLRVSSNFAVLLLHGVVNIVIGQFLNISSVLSGAQFV